MKFSVSFARWILWLPLFGGVAALAQGPTVGSPPSGPSAQLLSWDPSTLQIEIAMVCPAHQTVTLLDYASYGGERLYLPNSQITQVSDEDGSIARATVAVPVKRLLCRGRCTDIRDRGGPSDSFWVVGQCSGSQSLQRAGYWVEFDSLQCDEEEPGIHDPRIKSDPGVPLRPLPPPSFETTFTFARDLDDDPGVGMRVPLFRRGRSVVELSMAWHGGTLEGSDVGELADGSFGFLGVQDQDVELVDVDVLWRRTLFGRDRFRLGSVLGLGGSFAFEDEGRLGDSLAVLAGVRVERMLDPCRSRSLYMEVRGRFLPDREIGDFATEVRLGMRFRIGR